MQEDHGSVPETLSCSSKILTSNLVWQRYKDLDPWFGIEQEYTLMRHGELYDRLEEIAVWLGRCAWMFSKHLTSSHA